MLSKFPSELGALNAMALLAQCLGLANRNPGMRRRARHIPRNLLIGSLVVGLVLVVALIAPLIAPYAPDKILAGDKLTAPDGAHPFGTDNLGRDLFSRVLFGSRIALGVMALGVSIAGILGIVPGLIAGYAGGWLDQLLSRAMEIGQAFPGLLLAIVIVARLGPSLENAVLALGIMSAPGFYRMARSLTISARRNLYVEAALATGSSDARILFRHILPNVASSLVVTAAMRTSMLLLAIGGLSFVGLGAQPPTPEWGALLSVGRNYMETAPWLAVFPGLAITVTVVGANLLGDGLRDWLDPRMSEINAGM
jgi:peptide/nickel transport system permease protein